MKIKTIVLIVMSVICLNVYASSRIQNTHVQPSAGMKSATMRPGACEIELNNKSYEDVYVRVNYDDGGEDNTILHAYEKKYIDLYYRPGRYCEKGAWVYIESLDGYTLYSNYVYDGQTVKIANYMLKTRS